MVEVWPSLNINSGGLKSVSEMSAGIWMDESYHKNMQRGKNGLQILSVLFMLAKSKMDNH